MAAIAFPSIGILTTSGFTEMPDPNIVRSQMETGFAKQAKRSSVNLIRRNVNYVFTEAEYATFKTFFFDTSANGTLFFDWDDPVTGTTIEVRVVEGNYSMTPLTRKFNYYNVQMTFESYA